MQSQECWIQDETPSLQLCTFGRQRCLATPPRRFDLDSNQRIPTHFQVTHNDKAWSLRRFKTTCYLPNIDYNTNHDHRNDLYVVYDNICDNNQLKTAKLPRYFFYAHMIHIQPPTWTQTPVLCLQGQRLCLSKNTLNQTEFLWYQISRQPTRNKRLLWYNKTETKVRRRGYELSRSKSN